MNKNVESFLKEPFKKAIEKHFENLSFKHYDISQFENSIQITI